MSVSYKKLWKLLIDHNMNKGELAKATKMSANTLAKLTKQIKKKLWTASAFDKALRNMGGPLSANPWFGTKATSSGQVYKNIVDYLTVSVTAGRNELADAARQHDPKYNLATRRLSLPQILTQNRKNWFGRKTAEEKTFSNYPTKEHQTDRKKYLT